MTEMTDTDPMTAIMRRDEQIDRLEAEIERLRRDDSEYEAMCEELKARMIEIERLVTRCNKLTKERAAEREACARVAEHLEFIDGVAHSRKPTQQEIAAAIRARKDTP